MSRIGYQPVVLPKGVKVDIKGTTVKVAGPKGELARTFSDKVAIELSGEEIVVTRISDEPKVRALHGLTRALINNMVIGVSNGWSKTLQIEGVGYRVVLDEREHLDFSLGFSHPVIVSPPEGISFEVTGNRTIKVAGINKELVGQVAANIRALRPPEPYKGKGVRYQGEYVRRKAGKAGKVG